MMARTEQEKMLAGELYNADAPELQAEMAITHRWLARYNAALGASASELGELLLERLAAFGEGATIRPPFHCDYGFNISLGAGVFLNLNCVILDIVEVIIGEKTQIGPGVQILTADHPPDAAKRASALVTVKTELLQNEQNPRSARPFQGGYPDNCRPLRR
jgi:maltose O-acetyltransferase